LRPARVGGKLRRAHMLSLQTPRRLFERARARFTREAPAVAPHVELGRRGERLAADYLCARGFELVAANFKLSVGRNRRGAVVQNEIDLVAYEGNVLCFVEVKTRRSDWFAAPEANVDLRKQRQVTRAARAYRRLLGLEAAPHRYDVVTVILPPPDADGREPTPRVELLRGFWAEEKFRKRRWER
jgi:putative endonuclease